MIMIVPDINLLLYAYNSGAAQHSAARIWWETLLNAETPVGLPWAVACGFVRLATHARVFAAPMPLELALGIVESWWNRGHVQAIHPGPRHWGLLCQNLRAAGTAGALTTDAHLAALAMEWQCELHSNDADFSRFPGLRWHNPLDASRTT